MATGDKLVNLDELKLVYDKLHVPSVQVQIPTGQWSGSSTRTYTVNATNVTADTIIDWAMDSSINYLKADLTVTPGSGTIQFSTTAIPAGTINVTLFFPGVKGEVVIQTLADVYSKSQVDQKISQSTAIVYGVGTNIPSNSNFNNYTSPGAYSVASQAIAESITNIPYRQAGRLEVRGTLSTYIIQYYYPYTNVNRFYMRRYTNAWSDWYEYDDATQSTAKLKRITVTGVNSTNFMVTGFMAANGITPSKVLGVYINSDSGFSQQPISVFYNNIAADSLYIRAATAPTNGTLNITVAYLE